jgi:GT2 family glycosyltransferase
MIMWKRSMENLKISIVILTYNGWEYTHQLLMDIKRNVQNVHRILVVDNGSEDPSVQSGLSFWLGLDIIPLEVLSIKKNIGFIGGANKGIQNVDGDIIALFSNDVRIYSSEFVDEVRKNFLTDKRILLGPTCYTQNTGWNKFKEEIIPYVEGYCVIATKEFWNETQFDDIYSPSDFEDVDLSQQARSKGYQLKQLKNGIVQHLGGKTFGYNDTRFSRTKRNQKLFADKWGLTLEG